MLQGKSNKHAPTPKPPSGQSNIESTIQNPDYGSPLSGKVREKAEPVLGIDMRNVKVHTNYQAAETSKAINAKAFTHKNHIWLGQNQNPNDIKLMAHELTHVVQQRAGQPAIQRWPSWDDIAGGFGDAYDAVSDVAGDAYDAASDIASDTIDTATDVAGDVIDTATDVASDVIDTATDVASDVIETVSDVTTEAVETAAGAIDWLATEAGQFARRFASALGGIISITSAGIRISIPGVCPVGAIPFEIPIPSLNKSSTVPVFELPIGPDLFLSGSIGVAGTIAPEVQLQLGPICLRGVTILINPITNHYSISGGVSVTAAGSLGAEVRGGLRGELGLMTIVPFGPIPVPITLPLVGLEGGLSGKIRGITAGTFHFGGGLDISGGIVRLNQTRNLDLGFAADLFLGAYAQLDAFGKNICRIYWQPLEWHGEIAASLGLSADLTIIPGNPPRFIPNIDPPTLEQIPFDQIPLALNREGFEDDCPILDKICEILTELGVLPSQNGGSWSWSGPYGPGNRLPGQLEVYQRDPPGIASGASCRGACGIDCTACEEHLHYRNTDPDTGEVWEYTNFNICGSHDGCREHDAAFDWAADEKDETGRWAIVYPWHMSANIECTCNNLAGNCIAWALGQPPYDKTMYFADTAIRSDLRPGGRASVDAILILGDPVAIVSALAALPLEQRLSIAVDSESIQSLEEAIGASLWPVALRILNGESSKTVPSLDEAVWFLADQAIKAGDHARAFQIVFDTMTSRGLIDTSLANWSHVARVDRGEGVTNFRLITDPVSGERRARAPVTVEIYSPAFTDVGLLFSTMMHENLHVFQVLAGYSATEFDAAGNQRPEFVARDEVESYLWEIEHALGTGLINNVNQMRDLGRRLTTHFNAMTPALRSDYQTRYDAAQQRVADVVAGRPGMPIEEARRIVRESSREIASLLRQRPGNEVAIDAQIEVVRQRRALAMVEVALTDNPAIQVVRPGDPGVYRVPTLDADGRVRYLHGGIQVAWHMAAASPSAYNIGGALSAGGQMAVAGTAVQGRVHPFPPDIDFDEHIHVVADTLAEAGRIAASRLIGNIRRVHGRRVPGRTDVEFRHLISFPLPRGSNGIKMSLGQVLRGGGVSFLGRAISRLNGGNLNTFWRGFLDDGRFTDITKVVFVSAKRPDGTDMMVPSVSDDFNLAFLEDPGQITSTNLGEFAWAMCCDAVRRADLKSWLKAGKRAYNYFSTIGDTVHMAALEPVFRSPETSVEPYATVIGGIEHILSPADMGVRQPQTRILTVAVARSQVETVAGIVETDLPPNPGVGTQPAAIARDLRILAGELRARNARGHLRQDHFLATSFGREKIAIRKLIDAGVKSRVQPIIDGVVRPICPQKSVKEDHE